MNASPARDAAYTALAAQARKSALREIKRSARFYALHPSFMDVIIRGLSELSPRRAVECLELLFRPPAWRWFGFGGEHPALNLRGAMLYCRYARAKARLRRWRAA